MRTEPISPEAHHHRFSITSVVEFVLICILVVTVGYLYVDRLSLQNRLVEPGPAVQEQPGAGRPAAPSPEQYRAIAVLPFADMSEAGDQAWFAEGIAEELLHALAGVDELHVMARTSSFAFKDTDKTIAEIAAILGVQAVLEGSVRRFDDRVRVTAQLVDASSGYHIWSGSYERQLTDIFQLQDELARNIVQTLRVELGVERTKPLVAVQTRIPEAYNWFLRGRDSFIGTNPENVDQSIIYFEKAVEVDPDYALAWGYLAHAHITALAWRSFDEVSPKAISAYERALALDPEQSEALSTKALILQITQHDWDVAGELYKRAIASKEDGFGINNYAIYYLPAIDRMPQAIRLLTDAERRDPLHTRFRTIFVGLLLWSGDTEEAARRARKILQLTPRHQIATVLLILAYTETGNFQAVQRLLEQMPPDFKEQPRIKLHIGLYYAVQGEEKKARQIYQELRDNPPPYGLVYTAELALRLGEMEEAIDIMEREVDKNSPLQFWLPPVFRNNNVLQQHPRYQALLKRIGLDDESVAELHSRMSFE